MGIINDLAILANNGWKASDLIEVIKANNEKPAAKVEAPADDKPATDPAIDGDKPDYKALYEQAIEDMKKIQNDNTKEKIEDDAPSMDEIIKVIKAEIC